MNPDGRVPCADDIDELVGFLPWLYSSESEAIDCWTGGETDSQGVYTLRTPVYSETVKAFFAAAQKPCWRDHSYDPTATAAMAKDPAAIANASLEQIRALLTYCARGERFCVGFWASAIEDGLIKNILCRLKEL